MKKIKLLASLLAVGAASTMLATASFATDFTATAGYTEGADGAPATVVVSGIENYTANNSVGDYTIVILTEDAETVTDDNLVYVNQGTKAEVSTAKLGNLTAGATYYVRIGGASTGFVSGKFTVPGGSNTDPDNPYANSTVKVGDVNASTTVDTADLRNYVYHCAGVDEYILSGEYLAAADVNDSGIADTGDLRDMVYYFADQDSYPFACEYVKDKTNNKGFSE